MNPDDEGEQNKIAQRFGHMVTADHKVLNEEQESGLHLRCAVVVQHLATQSIQSYPCKTKSAQETQRSLRQFLRPEENPRSIYTDNSLGFLSLLNPNRADPKQMNLQNELYDD